MCFFGISVFKFPLITFVSVVYFFKIAKDLCVFIAYSLAYSCFYYRQHRGKVTGLAFNPGGDYLYSSCALGSLAMYDTTADSYPLLRLLGNTTAKGDKYCPDALAVSPDGRRVAFIGPSEYTVTVVDSKSLDEVRLLINRKRDKFFCLFFSVRLLSVLHGLSVFSSPPQRPMTSDFEGCSIPDFIHYIYFLILILEKEPVFSLLNVQY